MTRPASSVADLMTISPCVIERQAAQRRCEGETVSARSNRAKTLYINSTTQRAKMRRRARAHDARWMVPVGKLPGTTNSSIAGV